MKKKIKARVSQQKIWIFILEFIQRLIYDEYTITKYTGYNINVNFHVYAFIFCDEVLSNSLHYFV